MKKKDKDAHEREESEENVYSGDVREDMVAGGEISAEEEGFMAGYDKAEEDEDKDKDKKDDDEEDIEE